MTKKEEAEILEDFYAKISQQEDLSPEIQELINENFWDLI